MSYVSTGFFHGIWATFLLGVVYLACARMGGLLLRVLGLECDALNQEEKSLFSLALGISVLALCLLALGLAGLLSFFAATALIGLYFIIPLALKTPGVRFQPSALSLERENRMFSVFFIGLALLSWTQCLLPPIHNDSLSYHLQHPRLYIEAGRIFYIPETRSSLWPYQTEMLFLLGLLFNGTALAQLFHWSFYALTAYAVFLFCRRFYGAPVARIAATVFLLTPVAWTLTYQAYVELPLAFYTLLAVYAFFLNKEVGDRRAACLSGLFCGAALATKYVGLNLAALLFVLSLIRFRPRIRSALTFTVSSLLVAGVWYLRSWLVIGNPVYPFFHRIFGSGYAADISTGVGTGKDLFSLLAFPWNITMYPGTFGGELIGPLFLIFLPILIWVRPITRRGIFLSAFAFIYGLFLFYQTPFSRLVLTLIPVLSIGVALAFEYCLKQSLLLKRAAQAVLLSVLLLHAGIFAYRTKDSWGLLLGRDSVSDYLASHERSFQGHAYLNDHVKAGETIFNAAESRNFFNKTGRMSEETRILQDGLSASGKTLLDYIREKRFDYVWLKKRQGNPLWQELPRLGYSMVYSYSFREAGQVYEYFIYHLAGAPSV